MNQLEFDKQVDELIKASELYYHSDKISFLTDREYDAKLEFLEDLVKQNPELKTPQFADLLEKVASGTKLSESTSSNADEGDITSEDTQISKKVKHIKPMLSLAKANTEGEIRDYLNKTIEFGAQKEGWVLQAKLDGLAIAARYKNGKLTQLVTRGNGEIGEDISHQIGFLKAKIREIDGLPINLKGELANANLELRGEIFMTDGQFEFLNTQKFEQFKIDNQNRSKQGRDLKFWDDEKLKTSRNATAGLLNQEITNELKEFQKIAALYNQSYEEKPKLDNHKIDHKKYKELKNLVKVIKNPTKDHDYIVTAENKFDTITATDLMADDTFIAIDFETANGSPLSATEVGAVLVKNGEIIDEFHEYIKLPNNIKWPECPKKSGKYPVFSSHMAGKNVKKAFENSKEIGVSWEKIGLKLKKFCGNNVLVAHGANFDKTVLYSLNSHYKVDFYPQFVDSLENAKQTLAKEKKDGDLPGLKLKDLSIFLGITDEDEYKIKGHTAIFDAYLCGKVLYKLSLISPIKLQKFKEDKFNDRIISLLNKLKSPAKMSFLCYSFENSGNNNKHIDGVLANLKIDKSAKYGFSDVITKTGDILKQQNGAKTVAKTVDGVLEIIKKFGDLRHNGAVGIPTDGMVIKCFEDRKITAEMGFTAHHPLSQIAFKYPPTSSKAKVLEILTDVGRTGRLSYRARIAQLDSETEEGVILDGVTVKYATLHNYDWLSERDVRVGSIIQIVRANDVIPYVEAVLFNSKNTTKYPEPEVCPICEHILDKSTLLYRCPNEECYSRGEEALRVALSRKYLNVEYLSSETIDCLVKQNLVHDLGDVFLLTKEQLANLKINSKSENTDKYREAQKKGESYDMNMYFGEVRAEKVYQSIQNAKKAPLHKILASLNIRLLGLEVAKNLVAKFGDINSILNANVEQLEEVELVSATKSTIFKVGLADKRELIEKLKQAGFESLLFEKGGEKFDGYSNSSQTEIIKRPLEGQTVVLSGSFPEMNRDDAREFLESLGAKTSGSVSSKTTLVIADPSSGSSKVQKAKQLGIEVIAPDQFLEKFRG